MVRHSRPRFPCRRGWRGAALSGSAVVSPSVLFSPRSCHTPVKLAVAAVALTALPVVFLQETNARLTAEWAAHASSSVTAVSPAASASASPTPQAGDGDVLAAWNDLRAAQNSRHAAEERLGALKRQLDQIKTEVVVSYGQVEDLARRVAAKAREFQNSKT